MNTAWTWLLAIVLGHLATTLVHARAHAAAHVGTTAGQNAFILAVIVIGPVAGLWLAAYRPAPGGWLLAATMTGSLAFGIVNHFLVASPDRVDHVIGSWSLTFGVSAVLLAIAEAAGAVAGMWYAKRPLEQSS